MEPLVSIIVTTKNEERNISTCLRSVKDQTYPQVEVILVDNFSSDSTAALAKEFINKVYIKGPQRSAQLNYGVQMANGKYILYLDADMILSKGVVAECVDACEIYRYVALYIPETITGKGFWIKVRNFERSFYTATCIDAARFVRKDGFLEVGGFDENLLFGPDDWDFDRRIKELGPVGVISAPLYHNEGLFNPRKYLRKKARYTEAINSYVKKWGGDDSEVKRQVGAWYRLFGVFIYNGKWRYLMRYPLLAFGMFFLRVMVGLQYLQVIIRDYRF